MTERRAFEAKYHRYTKSKEGMVISFTLHPDDAQAWMATDDYGSQYMLAVQPITQDGGDETAANDEPKEKTEGENALASASMLAQDRDFQAYVYNILHRIDCTSKLPQYTEEQWTGLSFRTEIARAYIKEELGISTMKDIRDHPDTMKLYYHEVFGKYKDSQNG